MTIRRYVDELSAKFRAAGFSEPSLESRALVRAVLKLDLSALILREQEEIEAHLFETLEQAARRRLAGEPLAYIEGVKGFFKHEFLVESGVLVPRPETEIVVEEALRLGRAGVARFADFGCGTGCIGLSLLKEWKVAELWAIDRSSLAVEVTRRNARRLDVLDRVHLEYVRAENWKAPSPLDLVVANPPYIPDGDSRVEAHVHAFEPHEALYAGPEGLDVIRAWTSKAHSVLGPGGFFVMEIGAGQSGKVRTIMEDAGFKNVRVERDLAGIDRVISGIKE